MIWGLDSANAASASHCRRKSLQDKCFEPSSTRNGHPRNDLIQNHVTNSLSRSNLPLQMRANLGRHSNFDQGADIDGEESTETQTTHFTDIPFWQPGRRSSLYTLSRSDLSVQDRRIPDSPFRGFIEVSSDPASRLNALNQLSNTSRVTMSPDSYLPTPPNSSSPKWSTSFSPKPFSPLSPRDDVSNRQPAAAGNFNYGGDCVPDQQVVSFLYSLLGGSPTIDSVGISKSSATQVSIEPSNGLHHLTPVFTQSSDRSSAAQPVLTRSARTVFARSMPFKATRLASKLETVPEDTLEMCEAWPTHLGGWKALGRSRRSPSDHFPDSNFQAQTKENLSLPQGDSLRSATQVKLPRSKRARLWDPSIEDLARQTSMMHMSRLRGRNRGRV